MIEKMKKYSDFPYQTAMEKVWVYEEKKCVLVPPPHHPSPPLKKCPLRKSPLYLCVHQDFAGSQAVLLKTAQMPLRIRHTLSGQFDQFHE